MKLSVKNGDYGVLYDRDGNRIPYAKEADTETGRVTVLVTHPDDPNRILRDDEGEAVVAERTYPAPLRFDRRPPSREGR